MELCEGIIKSIKDYIGKEEKYVNPNFLSIIKDAMYDYYEVEDEEFDTIARDMWER